jgi:putative DNA primase/helicase
MNLQLSDEHFAELVEESAISPDLIAQRGYRTVSVKAELERLGFSRAQISVPALEIPWYRPDGSLGLYQIKPDEPRVSRDGRVCKYKFPYKAEIPLDVHPNLRDVVGNPDNALYVTEGIKKGDALASKELAAITLAGVWNFTGKDAAGIRVDHPDWSSIPLNDRFVYIVFDSDVMVNPKVYAAQTRLKKLLEGRGAIVQMIYLPSGENGAKVGVDDFFSTGRSVDELMGYATSEFKAPPASPLPSVHEHLEDAPLSEKLVVPDGYILLEDSVDVQTEDGTASIAHAPITITKSFKDPELGTVSRELTWKSSGEWLTKVVKRSVVASARELPGLADYDFPVTTSNASSLVTYLADFEKANEEKLPVEFVSAHMGWVNNMRGFLIGRDYLGEDPPVYFRGADDGDEQLADDYSCAGTFEEWRRAVEAISHYPRIMIALHASLASPLLEILHVPPFVFDTSGESTGGKTTALRVAQSPWGPNDPLPDWDTTSVAVERGSVHRYSLPHVRDETKKAKRWVIESAPYDFASGKGRDRGTKTGLAFAGRWRSVMLTSGEQKITSFTQAVGQHARVVCITGEPFGERSPEKARESETLSAVLYNNYGHAGRIFMRFVLEHRDEWPEWREVYEKCRRKYAAMAETNPVAARLSSPLAAIEVAGFVAREALGLPLVTPVKDLFYEITREANDADKPTEALRSVVTWAARNPHAFYERHREDEDNNPLVPAGGWLGKWAKDDSELAIVPSSLKDFLRSQNYSDEEILRSWKNRGWLDCKENRYTKQHKIRKIWGNSAPWLVTINKSGLEAAFGEG